MKTVKSQEYFQRAQKSLVGGVNSPVRSFQGVGGQPLVMKYGRREKLYDWDGNNFTDYCLSWGALILGHANRNVILAAKKVSERGLSFGTTTRYEIELAEIIKIRMPSIELIRFVNSGTEATMSAVRLARGFTGKSKVVKFDGCYHGHFDDFLIKAGSGVAMLNQSSSLGVPLSHTANTISLPYNNASVLKETLEKQHQDIACVILEPVAGNMGVIAGEKEFLKILREVTAKHGIVLIFDEVMTGFRAHPGGVQSDWSVKPDLTCLGKIIGSGCPVGAYGGRKDIMRHLAPLGGVYQAGTFSGTPVVMAAGIAGLKLLDEKFYKSLNKRCDEFVGGMNQFFKDKNVDAHLAGYGSMMSLRFRKEPVKNYEDALAAQGGERYSRLFWHLLEKGIYWPPADLETFFVSITHTKKDLDYLAECLKEFFDPALAGSSRGTK